jgi:hypothetical protein
MPRGLFCFQTHRGAKYLSCIFCTAVLSIGPVASADPDNIKFHVVNQSGLGTEVEFYSQNFNRSWPGGGKAWMQNDSGTHDYNLGFSPGEKICYGAWTIPHHTNYWGAGDNGKKACSDCCWVCGGNPHLLRLILSTPAPRSPPATGQRID